MKPNIVWLLVAKWKVDGTDFPENTDVYVYETEEGAKKGYDKWVSKSWIGVKRRASIVSRSVLK